MKAVRLHARGDPESLVYEEAPMPEPGPGEARLRVYAAGTSPFELSWPGTCRTEDGRDRLPCIPAHGVSGIVESLGPGVTDVAVGDAVYGLIDFRRDGCAAEYSVVRAADLARKPKTIDHVQAAAVPLSALTAWQALFDRVRLMAGQRVLIHGAAGGVGLFALQFAVWRGAEVIGTAAARDEEALRGLGAKTVIDYRTTPFEDVIRDVDLVLDTVGGKTLERSWSVLRQGGTIVSTVAHPSPEQAQAHSAHGVFFVVKPSREQLVKIGGLIDSGHIRPFIQTVLPLEKAREAYHRGSEEHRPGKIVLEVVHSPAPHLSATS